MNTAPIRAARVVTDADGTPRSAEFGDVYHPREGALAQARHVFIAGSGLPERWAGRERFVVLETGFGFGNNFLATWDAWRSSQSRSTSLVFISIEGAPPSRETLAACTRDAALAPLAAELEQQWPPLTWNLHRLDFEGGAVQLLLAFGDVAPWMVQLSADVDAFFLDGFAPAVNPAMWDARLYKAMARLAAPAATAATWTAARSVREGLRSAGFDVRIAPGAGHKRDITLARFAPGFHARRAPRRLAVVPLAGTTPGDPIIVVGAGLAGCAVAAALAEAGRRTLLLERNAGIACEGSGNAAGLFHGVVHGTDSRHARFYRAAAMVAQQAVRRAVEGNPGVRGSAGGLLRVASPGEGRAGMQSVLDRLGLPAEYVKAVDAEEASRLAEAPIATAAWYYPRGGWVEPRGLGRSLLAHAGGRAELRLNTEVAGLRREGLGWLLQSVSGATIARASVVVLANAGEAMALLGHPPWPVQRVRGQLTSMPADAWPIGALPRLPVAGSGYVLPPLDGTVWFGATAQAGNGDPSLLEADRYANIARLTALLGDVPRIDPRQFGGRTGFRWVSGDRLPLIGAVPDRYDGGRVCPDQPRRVARQPGLFVCTALGSRGIASSLLGARILASAITGAPAPVEADLLDAVDPARFAVREIRRGRTRTAPGAAAAQPPVGPMAGSGGT